MPTAEQVHDAQVKFPEGSRWPEFIELYGQLREALEPATLARVEQLVQAAEHEAVSSGYEEAWALVDNVARYFPAFRPAIRAVARHLFEDVKRDDCGVRLDDRMPAEWVPCVGGVVTGQGPTS